MILLKTVIKNKYVQAILRGLKPCVIGIVLATGLYMVFNNCVRQTDLKNIIITIILVSLMVGYKYFNKKKLSPISIIVLSAIVGIVVNGI